MQEGYVSSIRHNYVTINNNTLAKSITDTNTKTALDKYCQYQYQYFLSYDNTFSRLLHSATQGRLHKGGMVRDAPWRKLGGNVVMIMMLLLVSIIIYYYMNTFITLHQCTFNLLFARDNRLNTGRETPYFYTDFRFSVRRLRHLTVRK